MTNMTQRRTAGARATARVALGLLVPLAACGDDPIGPLPGGENDHHAVVLNSIGLSLTVFQEGAPGTTRTIPLGPDGTPTTLAVRGGLALVPLGQYAAVAVVDLPAGAVERYIPLPAGSGATGVAIVDDTLAFVANTDLNSVSPVLYRTGVVLDPIEVGTYPTALTTRDGRLFVVEANLVGFVPAGPSSVSVIDVETLEVDTSFALSGRNAAEAAMGAAGRLYVIQAGDFGDSNASLSVTDAPVTREATHLTGFGSFASEVEWLDNGTVLATSPVWGLAQVDPDLGEFMIEPGEGFGSAGAANVLGLGVDSHSRVWVIDAGDCASPGRAVRLASSDLETVVAEASVGVCPDAIAFTSY